VASLGVDFMTDIFLEFKRINNMPQSSGYQEKILLSKSRNRIDT
jgi:hypothetical protein